MFKTKIQKLLIKENVKYLALGKAMLILMIGVGSTTTLTSPFVDSLFGFVLLLTGIFGYYRLERISLEEKIVPKINLNVRKR